MPQSLKIPDLPYAQRPWWVASDSRSELQYLGWGLRSFGRHPVQSHEVGRWSYTLISRGTPTILLADGAVHLSPNQAILMAPPDTRSVGFRDEPNGISEILVWLWRTPPLIPEIRLPPGRHSICRMSEEAQRRLQAAHALCRSEVETPDKFTDKLLHGIRFLIDTEFARHLHRGRGASDRQILADRSVRWMQRHLHQPNAIFLLCDYLQISRSTLDRLFADVFGHPPLRAFAAIANAKSPGDDQRGQIKDQGDCLQTRLQTPE